MSDRIRVVAAEDDPQVQHKSYLNLVDRLNGNGIGFQNRLYGKGQFFYPDAHFVWIAGYADKSARAWMFGLSR